MKRKKTGLVASIIGGVILLVAAGIWFGDRKLKDLGHPGMGRFVQQLAVNYPKSFQVEPVELRMQVNEKDLEQLQQVVQDARERGVIIPEGNEYVNADITGPDGTFRARVRIKGKLTDHVQGSKWSFRVIAKKDGAFLGMRRFSLQHPGTRNYLYDWFHHQLMKGEGVIALRYGFIRLRFNDEDLGIYAYEEHFEQDLLHNNQRMAGPIFRFDPGLFWEHRLDAMGRLRFNSAYADYQSAAVDAFGSKEMAGDPEMLHQFEEAVALIDGFRRGRLNASQVFDVDKVARRHAILDLIGGHHSMDFSDVKFYYDPIARRVEPVAYESFSAFPTRTLAGSWRYKGRQDASQDLHDAWFNDPELFRRYVHHLERISDPQYLDSTFTALAPALDSAAAIIYGEFPWKEMDRSIFVHNQKVIRRMLDVPKGFHAHAQGHTGDAFNILAVPVEQLPLEVHGLQLPDGTVVSPAKPTIVPVRDQKGMGDPVLLTFNLPQGDHGEVRKMRIIYSVLGASVRKDLEVFPFAMLDEEMVAGLRPAPVDLRSLPWLLVDEEQGRVVFRRGRHVIDRDIVIPAGMKLVGEPPLSLDLRKGATIFSNSPVEFLGRAEDPIEITSTDGSGTITIIDAGGRSQWRHVELQWTGGATDVAAIITQQGDGLAITRCKFGGVAGRDLLRLVRVKASIANTTFAGGRDQLHATYSSVSLDNVTAYAAADDAIVLRGGMAMIQNTSVEGAAGSGIKAVSGAVVEVQGGHVDQCDTGVEIAEGATFTMSDTRVSATSTGLVVKERSMRHGPSHVVLEKVDIKADGQRLKIGGGNEVSVEGDAPVPSSHASR